MRAIWHGEQHLIFFVASFWLQKKLFGKTFWNKVVKKRRCERSYWRVPRCNPLKDKDIVSYRSSCPPCRRFRSHRSKGRGARCRCPPCRRFRSWAVNTRRVAMRCPPCRRFRRPRRPSATSTPSCPPCRRFRRCRRLLSHVNLLLLTKKLKLGSLKKHSIFIHPKVV